MVKISKKKNVGLEEKLSEWTKEAKRAGLSKVEARDMLDILWEAED